MYTPWNRLLRWTNGRVTQGKAASQSVVDFSGNNVLLDDRFGRNLAESTEEWWSAIFCTDIEAGAGNMFLGH